MVRSKDSPQASSQDPKDNYKQRAQGSGKRNEKARGPKFKGKSPSTVAGTEIPAGWAEEDADARLIWVKGSVEEGVVEQQQEQAQEDKLFEIP